MSFLSYFEGPMEITSLSGTIDCKMQPHIHIQLANGKGESIGGHLPSLEERAGEGKGCPIFTTLEIVLLSHLDIIYERKVDPETTFH
jgi:predicted DNA-binding protein with PD1-like motif